ncbi:MAG: ABC transporter substrate-binding protein [Armatimonadota bacterium]
MIRKLSLVCAVGLAAAMLAGCPPPPVDQTTGNSGTSTPGSDLSGTLKIGHFASLTGNTAMFGQTTDNGVKLAAEEISGSGNLKVDVTTLDDQSQQAQAPLVVNRLISQYQVNAIVGEVASSRSIAAAQVVDPARVPMVSPSSTNPDVTVDPRSGLTRPYVFRVCFTDPFQGRVMGQFVREHLKLSRAAVLKDVKNAYSVGLANGFRDYFTQNGGQIVAEEAYSEGDADFRSQLTRIQGLNPEVLVIPGYYREAGLIIQQARTLGLQVPVVGGDGWDSPTLTSVGAQYFTDCYFSNHFSPEEDRPEVKEFVEAYRRKFNEEPNALAALGYDSVKLVVDAARRAGSMERQAIRDALEQTKEFNGVAGRVSIDAQHNPVKSAVVVKVEERDGKAVFPLVTTIAP